MNGTLYPCFKSLYTTYFPTRLLSSYFKNNQLSIMCNRLGTNNARVWTPNHFVPLVNINPVDKSTENVQILSDSDYLSDIDSPAQNPLDFSEGCGFEEKKPVIERSELLS